MSLDSRNEELDKKLEENPIDDIVHALVRADDNRKNQVRWLAVSLLLDVLLTIAFGWVTIQTHNLAVEAESNKTALIRNCETANEARKNQRALWGFILSVPPQEPRTPEQQKRVDSFSQFVDTTFAPRDCEAETEASVIIKP